MVRYATPPNIIAFSTTRDGNNEFPASAKLFLPHHQVHGTVTRIIDEEFLELNALEQTLQLDCVDAMCTDLKDVCVCVKTADCIPVLLWHESQHIVSAVHAGWKGTMRRIVEHNIDTLSAKYGVDADRLHAIIGPGIGPMSFEVGDEVYEMFAKAGFDMERLAKRYPPMRKNDTAKEHWHIDLWECNRQQLISKGVPANNIHVAGFDTYAQHDRFYSARRNGAGRIINGIMMTSKPFA